MKGDPTQEEMAAIIAAIEMTWPRPRPDEGAAAQPAWRFSGRWWTKPINSRRDRPR